MTQIASDHAVPLTTAPGFKLRADAAAAWDGAVAAYGKNVLLTGAWRSYAVQERIFLERYSQGNLAGRAGYTRDVRYWRGAPWTRRTGTAAAAVPGTSNHGEGRAVDVKTRRGPGDPPHPQAVVFTGFNDPDRLEFLRIAAPYGWADDEGRSVAEPWHITYYPARDQHPAGDPQHHDGGKKMRVIVSRSSSQVWVTDGQTRRYIAGPAEYDDIMAMTGQTGPQTVDQATLEAIPVWKAHLVDIKALAAEVAAAVGSAQHITAQTIADELAKRLVD